MLLEKSVILSTSGRSKPQKNDAQKKRSSNGVASINGIKSQEDFPDPERR
jgi:hypothetical protein